jgi:DNA-binding response OmpR family regulator
MQGLLVEDDHAVAAGVRRIFLTLGLELDHVTTLAKARARLATRRYPFLILDRCLPDGDSIHLCRAQREAGDCSYIAFYSGLAISHDEMMECYEAGADFAYEKGRSGLLFGRHVQRALLERSGTRPLGPVRLQAELHRLHFPDGRVESLSEFEARFLLAISNCAPLPATESELVAAVWEGRFARERSGLPGLAKRVRDKLGEFEWLLQTVHGERSYQLVLKKPATQPRRLKSGVVNRETGEFLPGQMEGLDADADGVTKRGRKR